MEEEGKDENGKYVVDCTTFLFGILTGQMAFLL